MWKLRKKNFKTNFFTKFSTLIFFQRLSLAESCSKKYAIKFFPSVYLSLMKCFFKTNFLNFYTFSVSLFQLLGLAGSVPRSCCRLLKYDQFHDSIERAFDGEENTNIGKLLGGVKASYTFELLMETKLPEDEFPEYKPGGKHALFLEFRFFDFLVRK